MNLINFTTYFSTVQRPTNNKQCILRRGPSIYKYICRIVVRPALESRKYKY